MAALKFQRMSFQDFVTYLHETGLFDDLLQICKNNFVRLEDAYGPSKMRSIVRARSACWVWLHEKAGRSGSEIAKLWGREHSTVWNILRQHRAKGGDPI